MKKVIQWLAKVFNANIEVIREVEVVKQTTYYLPKNGIIDDDITIKGNLVVTGSLKVTGSLTCKDIN